MERPKMLLGISLAGAGGDDALVARAGTTGPITLPVDDTPVGADVDFHNRAVLSASKRLEGQAAARAAFVAVGQIVDLLLGGQVRVIAAFGTGTPRLLAAPACGSGLGVPGGLFGGSGGLVGGLGGFTPFAVELLFEVANAGLELLLFELEKALAFEGLFVHGLVESGLTPGLELNSEARTNRARPLWDLGSGTLNGG